MSDNVTWIVDLDASANEAADLADRVREWLTSQGIVSPISRRVSDGIDLLGRGEQANAWDAESHAADLAMCGLQVATERQVFHTGDNGIDCIRCPSCHVAHDPDSLPWSDAVEAWYAEEGDDGMACPDCGARHRIVDWEFEMPWAFGHLAFGFWNWPVSERLLHEVAAITGHRCRLVHEHI